MSRLFRTPDPAAMAASVAARPIKADPFRPSPPTHYGAAVRAALDTFRRPRMSSDIRYALVRRPTDPECKPQVFPSLATLAAFIQAERGEDGQQAFDAPVYVFGEEAPRQGVSLFLTREGDSSTYQGWVYLDGRGVGTLKAAMDAARPVAPVIGRAAIGQKAA